MKILIFVSSQSKSKSAVLLGGLIARSTGAELTLFTVIAADLDRHKASKALNKAMEWIPDLDVVTSFRIGPEKDCILEEIASGDYDLLIIRSRRAVRIKYFLASQISRKLTRQSQISVLVVKKNWPQLKKILICTCGKDIANPVIEMGAKLAKSTQAEATLLHVMSSVPSMYTGLDKFDEHLADFLETDTPAAQHLRQAISLLAEQKIESQLKLRHGNVPNEIIIEAQTGNYDLIVIGESKASANLFGWMMGNATRKVLNQSRCPVLVVRQNIS